MYSVALVLPRGVSDQLPKGYESMAVKMGDINGDRLIDYVIVVRDKDENKIYERTKQAPRRPLLIFIQKPDSSFVLSARNDFVVYRLDMGGQCDPFLDDGDGISIQGIFFTIENGVACGAHWTDYITFKYSKKLNNWIFHKRIFESWVMNFSGSPDAEALILDSKKMTLGNQKSPLFLGSYQPN